MKCKLLANQKLWAEAAKSILMEMPDVFFMRCLIIVQLRIGTAGNVICISYTCICHLLLILLMSYSVEWRHQWPWYCNIASPHVRSWTGSITAFACSKSALSVVVYPRVSLLAGNDRCQAISTSCQGIRGLITSSSVKEVSKCLLFLRVKNIRMRFGRKCMQSRVCETNCEESTWQPNRKLKLPCASVCYSTNCACFRTGVVAFFVHVTE